MSVITTSDITCPTCGFTKSEKMPTDACLFFYECTKCHIQMKPKKGKML
jgi:DNA-directed RNA polymerase subunit RPC12/RpoP